ncbi:MULTISPECIES: ABC transporter substrate-binding protein [unclassified Mesorhizobium]|uniref:ABC transporter substrate-binding protein n=1 Tax=unclassified Mesorhizobium TaxID=325217 RepID=UPI000F76353F|nr:MULTISPECIES: ABC transporter substrate-binding protein [unclassified Mesorhizobium]AZO18048.1 twin-arginine translocation signal domain-containing protein [Mesorhizobium sp. M2A.F.Ca.ET.043.05.1.1]RVB71707.1 twin-arginine translocation signal domain-containing protein [Mesorhizobium sp. M6A.T.Cr.TU.014.01.1.1]RWP96061.1 MAG: twin-arginine translocation signal domain-containing protein [Mesorhizobium sp.]RWP96970.1 MAG: twin-arginine translocation signal domain-containing protein [Mesorhizob
MTNKGSHISRRAFLKTGAALGGGVIAAGMPLSDAIWAAEGKVLKARSVRGVNVLDPGFYQGDSDVQVMHCIYSKLTRYKPGSEWSWELEVAEQVEQVDPTHIRFRLKKGIMFTGGYGEMTAKDVKFSFERVIKHNSPVKPDWGSLDRVEIENDYTGVIVLKTPFVPLWNLALPFGVGHIVSEDAVMKATKDGGDFGMKPPAFSGPYVLAEWKQNQYMLLTRNPDWSGPKPGFDEIRIVPMEDHKTAERAYQAGDVDFTRISLDSLATLKSNPLANTKLEQKASLEYFWLGMNMEHPKLKDINVRKAVQWAINVPQILDTAFAGQVNVATGTIAPGLIGHRPKTLVPPEGDLEKAKEFLEKAGVSDLALTIDCLNDSLSSTIAQTIQAQLSQIGIAAEVNLRDSGSWWTLGMESEGEQWKNVQLMVNNYSSAPDPYAATTYFIQDQVGVWNWERFRSDRFDELNAKAVTVEDPNERAKLYYEMQDIMEDSGAYRFLTNGATPILSRSTQIKAATRPDGFPLFLDFKPASA